MKHPDVTVKIDAHQHFWRYTPQEYGWINQDMAILPTDFHPYLEVVFEAFGPHRIMFGSDWPVCTLAGTYAHVTGIVSDYTQALSSEEQAHVWGGTARKFYGLE